MDNLLIENQVRQLICQISGLPDDFSRSSHLYLDLGVASVHALQLLTEIEEKFEIHVPDEMFVEATNLERIAEMLDLLIAEQAPAR